MNTPTTTQPVRVAVIVGSIRTDRFGPKPARWIADLAAKHDAVEVDLIDLADHDLPIVLNGDDENAALPEAVRSLGQRLAQADAFIVVTPVYNRSYPASLKNAIDWFYSEWELKPVAMVSYGGITGGLQAIDALHDVFVEFNAVPLRDNITFANFWETFDEDGNPLKSELMGSLADSVVSQLTWWAETLRTGRARQTYPSIEAG